MIDRRLTTRLRLAFRRLEISDRHCRRLLEHYREHGPLSLVNRRRGQPGNWQLMPGLAKRALRIIRERYADFGPTLACEKLAEIHGLYLAKEKLRKLMTQAGLWIPRKLRPPRVHQPRRACTRELIQIDGSEHRWLQNRLVKELQLRGITTPEAANAFTEEFIADYNRRFAKPPIHMV